MKLNKLILIFIILLGFLLRIVSINQYPPSLNWDEISHGYNAYSILKTGKDEWGISFPTIFRAYGDYKLPLYIYLTVPFVAIFGLNAISVKFVSILSGTFLALIIYLIIKKIFPKNNVLSLIGAALIAFSPTTIFLSRIALEANLFLFLFSLSIYFLITKKYSLSSFVYALSLLTYNSSRVLLPFYLALLIFLIIKNKYKLSLNWFKFIPFLAIISLVAFQMLDQSGQARYQWVSLLDQGSINQINELRQIYPRVIINKLTFFTFYSFKNYISFFNPQYLFFNGASNYQFSIPNFFLFSPFLLPFLLLGLIRLFKGIKTNNNYLILLFWLIISPLPSAITRDAPHILRGITFLPIIVILITLGFSNFNKTITKLLTIYLILVLVVGQFLFWNKYKEYSKNYSQSWQYAYKQSVDYIKDNYSQYNQIIFTKKYGEAHEFILFYYPIDPNSYHIDNQKNWDYHATWYWVNAFDKFKFINDWEIKDFTQNIDKNLKTLLITSPNNYNEDSTSLIKTINFLDQTPAFQILEIKP